jgi:hypothetical protein
MGPDLARGPDRGRHTTGSAVGLRLGSGARGSGWVKDPSVRQILGRFVGG